MSTTIDEALEDIYDDASALAAARTAVFKRVAELATHADLEELDRLANVLYMIDRDVDAIGDEEGTDG